MRILLIAASALFATGCATAGVEEPAYTSVMAEDSFEVRAYEPMILAETVVDGEAVDSRMDGFSPLVDYIFAKGRDGDKIAMTAPVTQEKSSDGWIVGFTMPAGYNIQTLPQPVDEDVKLVERPGRKMAVVSYSGFAGEDRMREKERELMARVQTAGLEPVGEVVHAFYDPPWTLPFMRRNEVMIEVRGSTSR